jgi:putative tryptophan/tyrosine transport system substrate-binding protein
MRRREFIALAGASLVWPFAAMSQERGRIYRVGGVSSSPRDAPHFVAMFDELRQAGFVSGQNLTIDWFSYGPRTDLIPGFAAELAKKRPDVLVMNGDASIRAAQQVAATIPILGITQDMVGQGFVTSLALPSGNTTGVSVFAPELDGKRQELLIEALPGLHRIAVLADSKATQSSQLQALEDAARARGVEVSIHRVANGEEIRATIDTASHRGSFTAIARLLWTASRRCAFLLFIHGQKKLRRAAFSPTAHASCKFIAR